MKTLVQKHWRLMGVVIAVTLLGGVWLWQKTEAQQMATLPLLAIGQAPYEPIDEVQQSRMQSLMDHIHLDLDALVALNLTSQQAETVVSGIRTWYENNDTTLQTLQNDIHSKISKVRSLKKTIAMGPYNVANEDALALARQELQDAKNTYETSLASLKTTVTLDLSASQQATWDAIKTGHGQQMPIRMLELTDAQRLAISKTQRTYRRQRMAASGGQERSTVLTTYQNSMDQILTPAQKTVIDAYNGYYSASSAAVTTAIETVLPVSEG